MQDTGMAEMFKRRTVIWPLNGRHGYSSYHVHKRLIRFKLINALSFISTLLQDINRMIVKKTRMMSTFCEIVDDNVKVLLPVYHFLQTRFIYLVAKGNHM